MMCVNWKLLQCASKIKSLEFTSLTVFESSLPDSMILKHKGIISVVRRKFITSASSVCKGTRHLSACNSTEVNNNNYTLNVWSLMKLVSFFFPKSPDVS